MQKRWLTQACIALGLFIVGMFAYWMEEFHKPAKEEEEKLSKRLFDIKDVQIQSVSVISEGKSFRFECKDYEKGECKPGAQPKWEMTTPRKLLADKGHVNSLVSSINNTTASEVIDLSKDEEEKKSQLLRDEYGLGEEARKTSTKRIEIEIEGDQKLVAHFGNKHPVGDKIFAGTAISESFNSNRVLLIPSFFGSNFDHDLTYWRDKKLVSWTAQDVASFDYDSKKLAFNAFKKDGKWQLKFKRGGRGEVIGDEENIDGMLRTVAFLSAKSFESEDKGDAKAKKALRGVKRNLRLSLTRKTKDETPPETLVLELFQKMKKKNVDKSFVTLSNLDPLALIDNATGKRLIKEVKDLRLTRLITSVDRFNAKRMVFKGEPFGAGGDLVIINDDSKWSFEGGAEVDQTKIKGLLDKLSGRKIRDFVAGKKIPKGADKGVTIIIGDKENQTKRELLFWQTEDKELYAKDLKSKNKEAFKLDPGLRIALPWERKFFAVNQAAEKKE